MKKLMFVAALAAMGSAFAKTETKTPCSIDPEAPTYVGAANVYELRMSARTTRGLTDVDVSPEVKGYCTINPSVSSTNIFRCTDTMAIQGWIYDCTNTCKTLEGGKWIVWDTRRQAELVDAKVNAWDASEVGGAYNKGFVHIIGVNRDVAEAYIPLAGTFAYGATRANGYKASVSQKTEMYLAGLGHWSNANGLYTDLSGNFAGWMQPSFELKIGGKCDPSQVWYCDSLAALQKDKYTVIFGSWSIRYNASASERYYKKGEISVPTWVKGWKELGGR